MSERPLTPAMTAAAAEILNSTTELTLSMAAVTRLPDASHTLQTLIGCRLVELLEIYIRRILELIFAHDPAAWSGRSKLRIPVSDVLRLPREELLRRAREEDAAQLAGKFEDTQLRLGGYLQTPPFTPEQLALFTRLKDVRNLHVHNNGRVDHAYAGRYPDAQVGDQIEGPADVALTALTLLSSVQRIDALVVAKYPQLAVPDAPLHERLQERMQRAVTFISPTPDERLLVTDILSDWQARSPELAALTPGLALGAHTLWSLVVSGDVWTAVGVDGRAVTGFSTQGEALAWVRDARLDGAVCSPDADEAWVTGTLDGGLVFRWPRAELGGQ